MVVFDEEDEFIALPLDDEDDGPPPPLLEPAAADDDDDDEPDEPDVTLICFIHKTFENTCYTE